jgi:hypothetical protein
MHEPPWPSTTKIAVVHTIIHNELQRFRLRTSHRGELTACALVARRLARTPPPAGLPAGVHEEKHLRMVCSKCKQMPAEAHTRQEEEHLLTAEILCCARWASREERSSSPLMMKSKGRAGSAGSQSNVSVSAMLFTSLPWPEQQAMCRRRAVLLISPT